MALRKLAAIAAMIAVATPSLAFDTKESQGASTMFYISIPFDLNMTRKEQKQWSAGLQLQGKREYQAVNLDSTMFNFLPMGGLEAKWIIAGVVAVGAAAAAGSKSSTTSSLQTQQTAHSAAISSGTVDCNTSADPCKK
jgi:hypothetical protein